MDMKTYQQETRRTRAPNENIGRSLCTTDALLLKQILGMVYISDMADVLKRSLFYRRGEEELGQRLAKANERIAALEQKLTALVAENPQDHIYITENDWNLVHCILGQMSETGELLTGFIESIVNKAPIDRVNLSEELGDHLWYTAMGLDYAESDFETSGGKNIAKLRLRYPEKFSSEKAVNRDETAERQVLEAPENEAA